MSPSSVTSSREEAVDQLHQLYSQRKLRLLVGNGISIGSGFPTWEQLNLGLLRQLVASDAEEKNLWANLVSPELPNLSTQLYSVLSRDGAADFVKMAKPHLFAPSLARVLYRGLDVQSLPLTPAHYQLAAMSEKAPLATTNFDPLLERALARLKDRETDWADYRRAAESTEEFGSGYVEHLHGWIDPDGSIGGHLVLTEADYFELARHESLDANRRLRLLFTAPGAALVLGMSMADINIRRLLYLLSHSPLRPESSIYVVLKQLDPLVDTYTQDYWAERRIRLLFVNRHEEIPVLLRDIQWGIPPLGRDPSWVPAALHHLHEQCPPGVFGDDGWQMLAYQTLGTLRRQITRMFAVPSEERCHLSLFVPLEFEGEGTRLGLVASSRKLRSGADAMYFAHERSLSFSRGREQGLAGLAYARGMERDSLYGDEGLDFNFTAAMRTAWVNEQGYRDWRSAFAVPLMDSAYRLPVAVLTITSNLPKPFWMRFEEYHADFSRELLSWMRRTARWLLGGFAAQ